MNNISETLEKGTTTIAERTLIGKDGNKIPVEVKASQLKTIDGNPLGILAVVRDITERKNAEGERERADRLESVGTLAGGIAHDFNNILTGILGNISLAQMNLDTENETYRILIEAERASVRARDLTQQLLTFSRGGTPVMEPVRFDKIIQDATSLALRGSNVKLRFTIPSDLWVGEADAGQINQVILNITKNAAESMPEGGTVNVSVSNERITSGSRLPLEAGSYVKISVQDKGTGISPEHLEKIFDPYFTTKQRGSGLGLAVTYSIVKNHGGHIVCESKLGSGSTFHIYLPALKEAVVVREEPKEEFVTQGQGRILVMDDEKIIRELLNRILTESGYEVELAESGEEAIDKYDTAMQNSNHFKAVIMDLTIPGGMGGKETIGKLLEIDPDVIAIVSSGYSTDPVMADYKKYGFKGVVTKPYNAAQVNKVLAEVLNKGLLALPQS